jgi:GT2 family glycosyltransferase
VNFNAGEALVACVRSVLSSTAEVEVFVVDNGSTDGSMAALVAELGRDPRLTLVEAGANLGFARANNIGIARAKGDFLLLLNPDCVIQPDTIRQMQVVMDEHPDAALGGCLVLNPDGTEQAGCRRAMPTPWRAFLRAFGVSRLFPNHQKLFNDFVLSREPLPAGPVDIEAISGAFMFVRRRAVQDVGPMDEGYFLHCEDLDWCMRFRRAGMKVLFVPGVRIVHDKGRCSRDRPIRVLWHMHRGMIRFYRKFFAHQYPRPLMWLVIAGIGVRLSALGTLTLLRRGRAR